MAGWLTELSREPGNSRADRGRTPPDPDDDRPCSRAAGWHDVFEVTDLLESHGVDYVLVGAYALQFNGIIRQTGDVDVLVADNPRNNRRWIEALSKLPDGVLRELVGEEDPFAQPDEGVTGFTHEDGDVEPGVIRVADRYVVDVMPKACGYRIDDLRDHIQRAESHGRHVNVLTLSGLRLVKQGVRPKDRMDLRLIETVLAELEGRASAHVLRMSRRRFEREAPPAPGEFRFQDMPPPDDEGERLALAHAVLERAARDGDASGLDAGTLAAYAGKDLLEGWLASGSPLHDLAAALDAGGVVVPRPG